MPRILNQRSVPLTCTVCGAGLGGQEMHVSGWAPGVGLAYYCDSHDPRKTGA